MSGKGFTKSAVPALSACESPIAGKFIQAIFDRMNDLGAEVSHREPLQRCKSETWFRFDRETFRLCIEHTLEDDSGKRAIVDATITMWAMDQFVMWALEFDGASYHSSKEQVAKDKKRDRWILFTRAIPVVRFSGSEIFSESDQLVDELFTGLDSCICEKSQFAFSGEFEKKAELERALQRISDEIFPFGERVAAVRKAEMELKDELVSH